MTGSREVRFTVASETQALALVKLVVSQLGILDFEILNPAPYPDRRLFINYRRDDNRDVCGRIYDVLLARFGKDSLFRDVESIPAGFDFRVFIEQYAATCDVMLVVIGSKWLRLLNKRRDDPEDFVRIEVETALNRGAEKVAVIPVFVNDARIPKKKQLPPEIQDLIYRNAQFVRSDPHFHSDIMKLIAAVEESFTVLNPK